MSLKWKSFIIFVTIFLAALVVTFASVFYTVSDDLEALAIDSAEHEIVSAVNNLENKLDNMQKTYYTTSFNKEIQKELQKPAGEIDYQMILDKMEELVYFSDNVYSIYLHDVKKGIVLSTETMSVNNSGQIWFNKYMPEESKNLRLINTIDMTSSYNEMFSYIGEMKVDFFGETVAYLSVNMLKHQMQKLIIKDNVYKNAVQFIVDSGGNVLAASENFRAYMLSEVNEAEKTSTFITCNHMEYFYLEGTTENDVRYVKLIPKTEMFLSIYKVGTIFVVFFIFFAILILFAVHRLLDYVTNPIYELSEKIRNYRQKENVQVEFKTDRTDEFAYLFKSLEDMTKHIDYLIDELYKSNLYKKETELKMYRSSIHPHFLFNLLDSIIWTLKFKDYEKVEKTLTNFSSFLRCALSQNKDLVMVREMKEWISSYSYLASFLKDDSIDVDIDIPAQLNEVMIPSMLVQPIVENSFKYAFKGRKNGKIEVKVSRNEDKLTVLIRDNGVGMKQDELDNLIYQIQNYDIHKNTKHFGLASVYQRLALLTDGNPVFSLTSREEEGTEIYFEIKV